MWKIAFIVTFIASVIYANPASCKLMDFQYDSKIKGCKCIHSQKKWKDHHLVMTMVKTCNKGNFIHMEQALSAGGQTITAAVYTAEWMDNLKKYSTKMSAPAYGNSSTMLEPMSLKKLWNTLHNENMDNFTSEDVKYLFNK